TQPFAVAVTGKFAYVTNVGSNNVSAYMLNATTGALTPAAGSPLAKVGATPTPERGRTVWCSTATPMARSVSADGADYDRAESNLCNGQFTLASTQFAAIVPSAFKYDASNGRKLIDIARGYFYSLVASGYDAAARAFLTRLETYYSWQPHPSDRLFWTDNPKGAFAAYAAEASSLFLDDSMVGDTNVMIAARAMSSGDVNAAIADLQFPVNDCGACTINSLQLLMLGDAYEAQRRWPEAFSAWIRAANSGHIVPEFDTLDEWNLSSLEMIYYYRVHRPR
ncbi:MAG TPA: hypothetical protein VIX12_09900, partial [Candidatus Binataceae bacterium]